jgi:hypothetical protein
MFMPVSIGAVETFDPALICQYGIGDYMMVKRSPGFNNADANMTEDDMQAATQGNEATKPLTSAAQRALAEAEARRQAYLDAEVARPKELGGRGGKEPIRYGDWEVKGLASDF